MYGGSSGPISVKWGVPPGWGLAEQEFEGGWGRVFLPLQMRLPADSRFVHLRSPTTAPFGGHIGGHLTNISVIFYSIHSLMKTLRLPLPLHRSAAGCVPQPDSHKIVRRPKEATLRSPFSCVVRRRGSATLFPPFFPEAPGRPGGSAAGRAATNRRQSNDVCYSFVGLKRKGTKGKLIILKS